MNELRRSRIKQASGGRNKGEAVVRKLLLFAASILVIPGAGVAGPSNDDFAAATPITIPSSITSTTVGATVESNEPTCNRFPPYDIEATVWFSISATQDRAFALTTDGLDRGFHAVYSGTRIEDLTTIDCAYALRTLNIGIAAGETVWVQVGAVHDGGNPVPVPQGTFELTVSLLDAPANDSFAHATLVTALGAASGDTANATRQPGERECVQTAPAGAPPALTFRWGNYGTKSVWYRFMPSEARPVTVTTTISHVHRLSSSFSISIYTGTSLASVQIVACSLWPPDELDFTPTSVTFLAAAETTYHLRVADHGFASGPAGGTYYLTIV